MLSIYELLREKTLMAVAINVYGWFGKAMVPLGVCVATFLFEKRASSTATLVQRRECKNDLKE